MEENASRLQQAMEAKFLAGGLNPQDFREVARTYVYGRAQGGINDEEKEPEPQDKEADPAYEPDDEDLANEDDDLHTDDERNASKRPSQV